MSLTAKMDKRGDLSKQKIVVWIILIVFLLVILLLIFGVNKIIGKGVDGIFGLFG